MNDFNLEELVEAVSSDLKKMKFTYCGHESQLWFNSPQLNNTPNSLVLTGNCLPAHLLVKKYISNNFSWGKNAIVVIGKETPLSDVQKTNKEQGTINRIFPIFYQNYELFSSLLDDFHVWVDVNDENAPLSRIDITAFPGHLACIELPDKKYYPVITSQVEVVLFYQQYQFFIGRSSLTTSQIMTSGINFFDWKTELDIVNQEQEATANKTGYSKKTKKSFKRTINSWLLLLRHLF
ncbi:hypothetical protein AB4160_16385 [Shewanella sp. 10N.286.51.B8]|uniref:hypothetical protein n=1 Tax=Shewanella sp. 10N.286.51.B8 TaxID=3229708 RepID=UPI00354C96F0